MRFSIVFSLFIVYSFKKYLSPDCTALSTYDNKKVNGHFEE
ncbi:hypothetical protein [Vibrio vulnificus YJ016]|uniref:Uncharacterized protein n=1 Tax=Vibrio vulnificus (strain YJ016) TaxID=196600 RepID=Q7MBP3_VIBVY|nr:hypothetical protein [Vibrio vulnificus YJ016]